MTDKANVESNLHTAAKLALETLEFIPQSGSMLGSQAETKRLQAIAVMKEALVMQQLSEPCRCGKQTNVWCMANTCSKAQQALDKKAENARELGLDYEPAQQEPVAHRDGFWCADLTCKKCYSADFRFKHKNSVVNESLTTPAQRTWVALTDEEVTKMPAWIYSPDQDGMTAEEGLETFARAIEAKLRSKNEDRN